LDVVNGDSLTQHPKHTVHLPSRYNDFVQSNTLIQQLLSLDDDEITVPINCDWLFTSAIDTVSSTDAIIHSLGDEEATDPQTLLDAKRSTYWAEWLTAINSELESLEAKGVYKEVQKLLPHCKPVQCKWVLHIKQDKDGTISRFKACLVTKGFTQIPEQDFTFTFTPVAHWDSICSLLCIAAINDLELCQLDIKMAYLNGPLDEEIYMKAPGGFNFSSPFWRLRKCLYGLRQASWQWYLTLNQAYSDLGYTHCHSDWSIYTRHSPTASTMLATSVDDIILASDSHAESLHASAEINHKFAITDTRDTEWILGCRITHDRAKHSLMIDQAQFTSSILRHFKMDECHAVTMLCPKWRLTADMSPSTDTERDAVASLPFCAIVGKCMDLATCTCPDISYAIRKLAHFMSNYGQCHYEAAKHLLRYLQGTRYRGIIYGDCDNLMPVFQSFTDSDWAMTDNCKSILGYIIECEGGPIAWSSKQQTIIALSSCEAKYLSCTHCACQIIWLRLLFKELGFQQSQATLLHCDNQGTVACSHDPHSHSCIKHIDIRAHFIHDCINDSTINVVHIPGIKNPADLLTKPLKKTIHRKWLKCLRLDIDQNKIYFPK
jgi:Reverse transcriptase (RNA-dependent DNA polymerase)